MSAAEGSKPYLVRQLEQTLWVALLWTICLVCSALVAVDPTHEAWIGMQIVGAVFGVGSAILLTRSVRIGLCVDADGALIRNMLRTRHVAWSQIDRFELRPARGPGVHASGIARLTDGGLVTIQALSPAIVGVEAVLTVLAELNAQRPCGEWQVERGGSVA
ncbi:MAG: hypothetical protein DLM57_08840 [Pseudonocardiales bacterium]|nr:MAG: hypothetical protein DLM57_08840 [Pseudonocardiales bacterium]